MVLRFKPFTGFELSDSTPFISVSFLSFLSRLPFVVFAFEPFIPLIFGFWALSEFWRGVSFKALHNFL